MSTFSVDPAQRAAYWPIPIARAIPAAVLGIVITFSSDHSARVGIIGFGIFALISGAIVTVLSIRRLGPSGVRPYFVASGVISMVLGAAALPFGGAGLSTLVLLLTVWTLLTGALELYSGIRTRRRHVASGDWITVGAISLLASLVVVLIPPDLANEFAVEEVTGVVDAAVVTVGVLGAYGAIIAVFLLIAGFSAKGEGHGRAAPVGVAGKGGPA